MRQFSVFGRGLVRRVALERRFERAAAAVVGHVLGLVKGEEHQPNHDDAREHLGNERGHDVENGVSQNVAANSGKIAQNDQCQAHGQQHDQDANGNGNELEILQLFVRLGLERLGHASAQSSQLDAHNKHENKQHRDERQREAGQNNLGPVGHVLAVKRRHKVAANAHRIKNAHCRHGNGDGNSGSGQNVLNHVRGLGHNGNGSRPHVHKDENGQREKERRQLVQDHKR